MFHDICTVSIVSAYCAQGFMTIGNICIALTLYIYPCKTAQAKCQILLLEQTVVLKYFWRAIATTNSKNKNCPQRSVEWHNNWHNSDHLRAFTNCWGQTCRNKQYQQKICLGVDWPSHFLIIIKSISTDWMLVAIKTGNPMIHVIDFKMLICVICREHKDSQNLSLNTLYGSSEEKSCKKKKNMCLMHFDWTKLEMTQKTKVVMLLAFKVPLGFYAIIVTVHKLTFTISSMATWILVTTCCSVFLW